MSDETTSNMEQMPRLTWRKGGNYTILGLLFAVIVVAVLTYGLIYFADWLTTNYHHSDSRSPYGVIGMVVGGGIAILAVGAPMFADEHENRKQQQQNENDS